MVEHTKAPETTNPKKPRGLSRSWLYEQLAGIHRDGLNSFEATDLAKPLFKKLSGTEYLDLMERLVAINDLQATDVARVVEWRRDYLRFIVASAADPSTPAPKSPRIPTAIVRTALSKAEQEHKGATNFNRLLAEQSGIPLHTIRRIRAGARKWLTPEDADSLLGALSLDHLYRELVTPIEEDHAQAAAKLEEARAALDEELRPILRVLAAASSRGHGGYTAAEQRALEDWRWMHGGDWPESVVPLFTLPKERNEILLDHFTRERRRPPEALPERIRQEAIRVLQARQKREREDLQRAEDAVGRFPINSQRIYELTRGARRKGYLPKQSKARGYDARNNDA